MNLQDVATALMQPGDDEHFVAGRKSMQPFGRPCMDVEPRIGRAFVSLPGRLAT